MKPIASLLARFALGASLVISLPAALSAEAFTPYAQLSIDGFTSLDGGSSSGSAALFLLDAGGELSLTAEEAEISSIIAFNVFFLEGDSPSGKFVGDSFAVSNLDSDTGNLRLFNLYLQTEFKRQNLTTVVGQIAADSDFFASEVSGLFSNSTFGWAPAGIQAGAPAYAQASLGGLVSWQANETTRFLSGIYSTDIEDPESSSSAKHGYHWELPSGGEMVWFNEVGLSVDPGTLKLGLWLEDGSFENHAGTESFSRNHGWYVVLDEIPLGSLQGFVRYASSPSDRNAFSSYLDFGVSGPAPFGFGDDDTWGIAYGVGSLSGAYKAELPTSSNESVLELTWQVVPNELWAIQPILQFVQNPAGPEGESTDDATVLGLRVQRAW